MGKILPATVTFLCTSSVSFFFVHEREQEKCGIPDLSWICEQESAV